MPELITQKQFAEEILRHDNIWILTHGHPDGDTVGSGEALLECLRAAGKNVALLCCERLNEHLSFMSDYADSTHCFFGNVSDVPFTADYIVSVDVAAANLISGTLQPYAEKVDLALDHHEINTLPCKKLFLEAHASSAGETLYGVLCEIEKIVGKELLSADAACALYAAIASDSGNFKYASTSARTMKIAAELIERGAKNAEISRYLFDIQPFDVFRAEALCVENAAFYCDGKVVFSYMTIEQCAERALSASCFDTCVGLLRSIEGVEVAIFAKEKETLPDGGGRFRLSLRSNEYVNVAELAANFDGGGHKRAAGCVMCGTAESMAKTLCDILSESGSL